ncbi:MAG TPA: FtsX-like permease family protein [Humibacter sp.]|nr:FtsX-like permease family protein [Humibacter sp.]
MNTIRLACLLGRPGASGRAAIVLPVVAFGVTTALLLTVLAGALAFFTWTGGAAASYQVLAVIALALLIVPLLALGGSAARLAARRRDDRLAILRLLGASAAMVARLTVLESTVLAVVGAVAGAAGYALLVPLVGLIPFRGAPLGVASLWLPVPVVGATVLAVAMIAAASAAIGLRAVVISPLGVRTRQSAPRLRRLRVVIGAAVIAIAFVVLNLTQLFGGLGTIAFVLAVAFGGALAVLNVIGPFVIGVFARRQVRRARTAQRLLAARGILESPKAAWRQIGGVAMTSFVAVFAGTGVAVAAAAGSGDRQSVELAADIRTGVVITVAVSFLMVACSVGVNQASAILDRRSLYVSLDRLGMPIGMMDAARRRAVLSPLRIVTVGSSLVAAVLIFPLVGLSLIVAPLSLVTIAGCLAAGILLVWLGLVATRPVLTTALGTLPDAV